MPRAPRPPTAAELVAMSAREALQVKLAEVRASRAAAEKKGSFTNIPALHRTELDILSKLSEPVAAEADPVAGLDDDALVALVVEAIPDMQPSAVGALRAALDAAHPRARALP